MPTSVSIQAASLFSTPIPFLLNPPLTSSASSGLKRQNQTFALDRCLGELKQPLGIESVSLRMLFYPVRTAMGIV